MKTFPVKVTLPQMNAIITLSKKQYNEETHNIYNIDKAKTYHTKENRYTDEHYYNKAQTINNNVTNNTRKQKTLPLILNMYSTLKRYVYPKNYISNNYNSQIAYVENSLYKKV